MSIVHVPEEDPLEEVFFDTDGRLAVGSRNADSDTIIQLLIEIRELLKELNS